MCRSVAGLAGVPGSGEVAHRAPVAFFSPSCAAPAGAASGLRAGQRIRVSSALSLALALAVGWLIVDPRTPDLAAQVYRVRLFEQLGWVVWDEHWYAGHHMAGCSLLLGPLASLLGLRLLAVIALLASTALFARLARLLYGPGARWGAAAFAVAAAGDVWIGRISFALGVTCALAAVLALVRLRPLLASGLAALCAAASPVAGRPCRLPPPLLPAAGLCVGAGGVRWGPVREALSVASHESPSASFLAPVERFLAAHVRGPVRVEVPFTRSHWEAALLAPSV